MNELHKLRILGNKWIWVKMVDLRDCLQQWPYDVKGNVRITAGTDGREIILVRQPMGLEQYELNGRPDGQRMHDRETLLDFHEARINAAKNSMLELELTAADCTELFQEAASFYQRLIVLFRLKSWTHAERDAIQILRVLEFVRQHAHRAEDRVYLEPWRPHAKRIQAVARAMISLNQGEYGSAFQLARDFLEVHGIAVDCVSGHGEVAETLLESVRDSLATCPMLQTQGECCFSRQDDFWMIRYQGQTTFLKSTRGLHSIACLLRFPNREFHVSELLANIPETSISTTMPQTSGRRTEAGNQVLAPRLDGGSPVLDGRTKAELKRRINELREEREEAERFNDTLRAARARDEHNAIALHLASALGLGGRDRTLSSEAERARSTVTKRIRNALQQIDNTIPQLGHHLRARIKTGYFCSYHPYPDHPACWKF